MAGTDDNPIEYPKLVMPEGISRTQVRVRSNGLFLDADLFLPGGDRGESRVPGIVLSHGIGGDKHTSERYAASFAVAGMAALTISQSGWGESQGPVQTASPDLEPQSLSFACEPIDPLDWVDGYRAAVDYLCGEPLVDTARLGAWGTSFGGGTAAWVTATDPRIKALSIQVPAVFDPPAPMVALGQQHAVEIARGERDPFNASDAALPDLRGTPRFDKMARFMVGTTARAIRVPTLIMDAAEEELFDIRTSGGALYAHLVEVGVESDYDVIPNIDHYGIYFDGFEHSCRRATDWFLEHLA